MLLSITSCATTKPKEVIIYKVKKVYIPTPCDVEVYCDFKGVGFDPTIKLLHCVEEQKRALEYCKHVDKEVK